MKQEKGAMNAQRGFSATSAGVPVGLGAGRDGFQCLSDCGIEGRGLRVADPGAGYGREHLLGEA